MRGVCRGIYMGFEMERIGRLYAEPVAKEETKEGKIVSTGIHEMN